MEFGGPLIRGTFLSRPNRFLGRVSLPSGEAECFVPNSGRLAELLGPGATVYVREVHGEGRRTGLDLVLACHGRTPVSVDTRAVTRLVPEAIRLGTVPSLQGLDLVRTELPFLESRIDFLMERKRRPVLLEAKSCTLVEGGVALFPDAPTTRRRRHLEDLARWVTSGKEGIVVFVVQREDARSLSTRGETDPGFAGALRAALAAGVNACAFTCRVTTAGVTPLREIPVRV